VTDRVCRPLQRSWKDGWSISGYFLLEFGGLALLDEETLCVSPEKSGRPGG
jgi:hypothetical protein